MTTEVIKPDRAMQIKRRLALATPFVLMIVTMASAAIDINGTVGPLIEGVIALLPSVVALVLALIPVTIVVAVAKFFPQLFNNLLDMLKF